MNVTLRRLGLLALCFVLSGCALSGFGDVPESEGSAAGDGLQQWVVVTFSADEEFPVPVMDALLNQDRNLALGIRANLLTPGTRVLFVDDWVDTGGWTATIEQPRPTPMDHNRD